MSTDNKDFLKSTLKLKTQESKNKFRQTSVSNKPSKEKRTGSAKKKSKKKTKL